MEIIGITQIFEIIKNIIFPPKCVFCQRMLEPNCKIRTCGTCGKYIDFCEDSVCCEKCGKPILGFGKKQICYFCLNHSPKYFDRITSVFIYNDIVRRSVIRYKEKGYSSYSKTFAECINTRINYEYKDISFDFVCGAPPHNKKQGFDQVELLAKEFSRITKIPFEKGILHSIRDTKKQSELGFKERLENMKGSLEVISSANVNGKTVLLLDDVCTTRSTIIECARALKKAGAARVYAATIATVEENEEN